MFADSPYNSRTWFSKCLFWAPTTWWSEKHLCGGSVCQHSHNNKRKRHTSSPNLSPTNGGMCGHLPQTEKLLWMVDCARGMELSFCARRRVAVQAFVKQLVGPTKCRHCRGETASERCSVSTSPLFLRTKKRWKTSSKSQSQGSRHKDKASAAIKEPQQKSLTLELVKMRLPGFTIRRSRDRSQCSFRIEEDKHHAWANRLTQSAKRYTSRGQSMKIKTAACRQDPTTK